MQIKIEPSDLGWWFWVVTSLMIVLSLLGWTAGYYVTISLSLVHALFFLEESKNVRDFATQTRLAFFVLTLFGIWPGVRGVVYLLLLAETVMIALFDHSVIGRTLKQMSWNRGHPAQ
jgi:hypothetical protein